MIRFTRLDRALIGCCVVVGLLQLVIEQLTGTWGWGYTHPAGDYHLFLSVLHFGSAVSYSMRVDMVLACNLYRIEGAGHRSSYILAGALWQVASCAWLVVTCLLASSSLALQLSSAHYQGKEHWLAGLFYTGCFAAHLVPHYVLSRLAPLRDPLSR